MFTLGNFITLGIVLLLLVFYRQLDKRNRTLDKVRKYADHLKNELNAFVTEKENAVKDYSVSLDVEQKSAKELMKRVQLSDAELAEKAKAIAKIDERITAYDASLEELVRMTARVQENLTRIREESSFIESVDRKIVDVQNRFEVVEQQTAELKQDFTRENAMYLERIAGEMLADVKSSVTELKNQSQAVERSVSQQCAAMEKAELIRATNLQRDMDILNRTLKTVMERAANKADTLEVEILDNLKVESEKRIQDLQSSIEETFKDSQAKAQEQLDKVRSIAEENQSKWEADRVAFEAKEYAFREELTSDVNILLTTLTEKSDATKKASAEDDVKFKKFLAEMEATSANVRTYIVSQNDALEQKFNDTKQRVDEAVNLLETRVKNVSAEAEQKVLEKADERLGNWRQIIHEADANLQKMLSDLESSSIDIQDHFAKKTALLKQRLEEAERQIETETADLRNRIDKISEESQAHVADEAQINLEQILQAHEEQNSKLVKAVKELEIKAESIKNHFDDESAVMSRKLLDAETYTKEAVAGFDDRLQRTATEVERKVIESADLRLEDWKKAAVDADVSLKNLLVKLETSAETARVDFDTEKANIAQKLADVSLQTEQAIDGLKENIVRASESVEAKIANEADAKLQQWLAVSQDRNDKARLVLEELEKTTAQAKSAFDAEAAAIDKRLDEAKTHSDQMIDSWSANLELRLHEADKKLADTETYVERTILDSEKRIATTVANAELSALEKADAELAEWHKRFEEQMADRNKVSEEESLQNRQRFEDLSESFDETKEHLVKEIEETKDRLSSVQGEMDTVIEKIKDAIRQAVEATDEKAESAAKNRLLQWQEASKQAASEAESRNSAFFARFNQNCEQATAGIEKLEFDLIDKFNQTYEKISAESIEQIDNLAAQFKKTADEREKRGEDLVAQWERISTETSTQNAAELSAIEANFLNMKQRIADAIADAELRLHSIQEKMDETIHHIEYVVKDTIANTDVKAAQVADDRLAQWKQASEQTVASSEERTQALVAQWERAFVEASAQNAAKLSAIETNFTEAKQRITDEIVGIESRLREAKENADRSVEGIGVDVQGLVEGAEGRLRTMQAEMDETVHRIENVAKDAVASADAKAVQVADDRLAQWKQASEQAATSAEERTQALVAQWERAFVEASAQNAAKLSAIETNFTEAKQRITDEIVGIESRLREAKENADRTVEGIGVDVQGLVEGAAGRLRTMQAEMDETASRIESVVNDAVASADAKAVQVADDRLAQWKQASEQAATSADERTQAFIAQWEQVFAETSAQNAAELSAIETNFTEAKQRITDEIAGIETRLREAKENADRTVEGIGEDVKGLVKGAEGRLRTMQVEMDETASRIESVAKDAVASADVKAAQVADDRLAQWKQASEQAATSAEERTQAFIAQWERIFAETSAQNAAKLSGIEANFTEVKQRITDEIAGIESRLREAKENADRSVEGIGVDVQGLVEGAEGRLRTMQAEMDETASRIESVAKEAVASADAKAVQVADDRLAQWKQASEQAAASVEERTQALVVQWERVFAETSEQNATKLSGIEVNFTEVKQRITDEIAGIETRLREAKENADRSVEGIGVDVQGLVEGVAGRLRTMQAEMDETASRIESVAKDAVASADVKAAQVADDRLAQWERVFAETSEQNAAKLSAIETNFTEAKQRIIDEIAGIETRLREAKENADRSVEGIGVDVQGLVEGAAGRLRTMQAEMDETVHRIESVAKDAVASADAKAVQVADDRLAQWKQASEQAVASAEEQANTFIAQCKQIHEQSIAAAEERANNFIDQFKKDADENTERNKILLDQWRTAAETITVQDRAQLAALRDSWNQTKNQWSGEIIDAENRLKFLESQIKESSAHIGIVMKEAVERAEATAHNQADKRVEEWRRTVQQTDEQARNILADFETSLSKAKQSLEDEKEAMDERFKSIGVEARDVIDKLERQLQQSVEDMEQRILDSTDVKFEEYQKAQSEQFQRFEALADDAMMLDEELRRYLAEVQERVKKDFSAFEQASGQEQAMALADFTASSNSLKVEMGNIEKELTTLKETAYNNVSEKLDIFENDFSLNLVKRSDEIDKKLNEWRQYLDNQLKTLTEDAESKWKVIEASYMEQFSAKLVESNDNWLVELEKLKSEAGDFEENIRVQMKIADDSLVSLKEQFTQGMEDARSSAEASLKAEIGRHNLTLSDTLKQSQRDMGAKLKHLQDDAETRNNELISLFETSRHSIDEWKAGFNNQLRDMETALEETRKRSKDLVAESNERLSSVRASLEDVRTEADAHRAELFSRIDEQARSMDAAIKDAERHIKDFAHQTSLFERADILKVELEHYIEDLHSDLDKIDQHKTESTNLENQFIRIKRLEDEVNAKMTRFLSEKHRIEQMETEFNRLLQTSKAVDEKLAQLSASDDTLQAMQVQIRKFNDALDTSEEKFKRIERKNQTLDATNEGIDRNFKTLQESEQTVQRIGGELTHLSNEVGVLRTNIGYMAKESEKAKSVADKVSTLDTTLSEIDQRIATVQASREWLARLETRLEELNKQAQDQVKLIGSLMKDNSVPLKGNKGAPPIGTRENVIKLSQQGWTVDEIARAQKLGRGEVELILELAHNG